MYKWIVFFARADWLARRWLAKYYLPPSSLRETKPAFACRLVYRKWCFGPLVIQLDYVVYLFTSVSVNVVDFTSPRPPLLTSTLVKIVNYSRLEYSPARNTFCTTIFTVVFSENFSMMATKQLIRLFFFGIIMTVVMLLLAIPNNLNY